MKNHKFKGYLLIEILISIAVLSILVVMILPNIFSLSKNNENNKEIIEMNNLASSIIESYSSGERTFKNDKYLIEIYESNQVKNIPENLKYIKVVVKDKNDKKEVSLESYYIED